MQFLRFLNSIPFKLDTVDYGQHWSGEIKGITEAESAFLQRRFPVKPKRKFLFRSRTYVSVIQNLSVLKSCIFYHPTLIPSADESLVYLRIPKSGSSSIISYLLRYSIGGGLFMDDSLDAIERLAFYHKSNYKLSANAGIKVFTVVRNPFARLVSAYLNSFDSDYSYRQHYGCYLFGIVRPHFTFTEFINCISLIPKIALMDSLTPQTEIIARSNIPGELRIFKIEKDMDEVAKFLQVKEIPIKKLNMSSTYDFRNFYTRQTLRVAYELYANDVVAFDYDKEFRELETFVAKKEA